MKKEVLEKLYSFDTKLSEEKIELALVDDLNKALSSIAKYESEVKSLYASSEKLSKIFIEAKKEKDVLEKKYTSNKDNTSKVGKDIDTLFKSLRTQAKELGIDINSIPVYKEYVSGLDKLRSLSDENQNAWNLIYNY